jgi:cation transport protein ChaC
VTQRSSDEPKKEPLRPSGPGGQLARNDFTPERIAAYAQLAQQFGDAQFLSEEVREKSRAETLAQHVPGTDLWVFGYGSLMWNPAVHVDESLPGRIDGFQRQFCMRLMFGRAMPDNPGLMLCLVPGGSCWGIAHRIAPDHVESESKILWMREMLSGAYVPTWVDIDLGARHVRGVTFVINTAHPRYLPDLDHDEKARRIAKAEGHLGSNRDYLFRTAAALESAGVKDAYIDDIHTRVRALIEQQAPVGAVT